MFYPFFSQKIFNECDWSLIWEVETAIQAMLLDDISRYIGIGLDELQQEINKYLVEVGFSSKLLVGVPTNLRVNEFFNNELRYLADFLCNNPQLAVCDSKALLRQLMPVKTLEKRMKESETFRKYIERGKFNYYNIEGEADPR